MSDERSLIGRGGTARDLRRLLTDRFLRGRRSRWIRNIARIEFPDGAVLVFDPLCYDVRDPDSYHALDITLQGPPGEAAVHLQFWGRQVSAVEIRWNEGQERCREPVGSVGVDSATLAIASAKNLQACWKVGGPRNRSYVLISYSLTKPERVSIAVKAAQVLQSRGFQISQKGADVEFLAPLEDVDMDRANEALVAAQVQAEVMERWSHSGALLSEGIDKAGVAVLEGNGRPYLVGFMPGWGDGTYEWYVLKDENSIVGFSCNFLNPKE